MTWFPAPPILALLRGAPAASGAAALLLGALAARAGESPLRRLPPDGTALALEVRAPGDKAPFVFGLQSGCRYRLTVEPGTLERAVVDLSFGDVVAPQRFGSPERGRPAVHEWDAEGDALGHADVMGFSALTGTARIRLEALGPDGARQQKPRPWLGVTGERARVGDLMLGESDRWELAVTPGVSYELEPTRGTAPGVRLRVVTTSGRELAAGTRPWLPFDELRFRAPLPAAPPSDAPLPPGPPGAPGPAAPPAPAEGVVVEVRGVRGSGGSYGLRLKALPDDAPLAAPPATPYPAVERGPLVGEPLAFRANPGDVALLATPAASGAAVMGRMQARLGEAWLDMGPEAPITTMMSPEGDHLAWFRPEQPGTYRFGILARGPSAAAPAPVPLVLAGDDLGGAPLLIGVPNDPAVRARLTGEWTTVGLAATLPSFPYLFVAVEGPTEGIALRVRDLAGKVLASRPASGEGLTHSPGLGPTLRFRAPQVGLLRLEAKGKGLRVYALLRRASN